MRLFIYLAIALTLTNQSFAAENPGVWIDIPVYDYPFVRSTDNPPDYFSMRQSVALSNSYYQTIHRAIGEDSSKPTDWWRYLIIGAYDYFTSTFPLGNGWTHEEWHRSVMTNRKIGSFNEMNTFPFGSDLISVDHVSDADLVALKKDHPADMVRLSAAGMEAQVYQNMQLEKSHFYRDARSRDTILLWLNTLNVTSYMTDCSSTDSDSKTDKEMAEEGANVKIRDFTGLDCDAWVYDLFRPDEPYANRGTHPSGVGIKRYIKWSDLTDDEQKFLKLQTQLSYLNFVDPFLFGITSFKSNSGQWNFKLNHYLTAFGGTVDANLFLERHKNQFLITLHNGMTNKKYYPGTTLKWIDLQLMSRLYATLSGTIWQQPRNLRLDAEDSQLAFDGSLELALRLADNWEVYAGYESKNAGWIAGNVYLEDNWSAWTGIRIGVF